MGWESPDGFRRAGWERLSMGRAFPLSGGTACDRGRSSSCFNVGPGESRREHETFGMEFRRCVSCCSHLPGCGRIRPVSGHSSILPRHRCV